MPCTPFQINGARGFVCTRGPRPRCACGKPATLQCDAPTKRRSGTCDKHLCAACATGVGPDRHLCPGHVSTFAGTNEAPKVDMEPWQAELF